MALDFSARREVEQMIQTALQGERSRQSSQGLTRNGTVTYYDSSLGVADVLIDGDSAATKVINATPVVLTDGQRVTVMFQEPHGSQITGVLGYTPPVVPDPPQMKGQTYFYSGGGQQNASTSGNNGFGTWTIDVASRGILVVSASAYTISQAIQEMTVAPVSPLQGSVHSDRTAGASANERFNLFGLYYQSLSAGATWTPTVNFTVGTGPTDVIYTALSGFILVIPNTQLQP